MDTRQPDNPTTRAPEPTLTPLARSTPWPLSIHWALALGIAALWLLASLALDRIVYESLKPYAWKESDFLRLLRVMGVIPTWFFVSAALLLIDRIAKRADGTRAILFRGTFLLACTITAGITGEILKLIIRRERPEALDGQYSFRPFTEGLFNSSNLGMPSTHAIVAFAAAWALYRLHPSGWPVYFALAVGCAATRLMEHAHFLSDVYAACAISYFVVRILNLAWVDPRDHQSQPQTTPKESQ